MTGIWCGPGGAMSESMGVLFCGFQVESTFPDLVSTEYKATYQL